MKSYLISEALAYVKLFEAVSTMARFHLKGA